MTKRGPKPNPNRQTRSYGIWCNMKARCSNPNNPYWKYYGGRGIKVCESWQDFNNFFADMGESPVDTTIERVDGDRDYEPSNCIWATRAEQQLNLRSNHNITFNGETKCAAEWGRVLGINPRTIYSRLQRGWPIELLLNAQKRKGIKIAKAAHYSGH